MKYFFTPVLICAITLSTANAQEVRRIPVQFEQFFNSYSIINPASCGSTAKIELQSGRQQHGGPWKNISTTFASGLFKIEAEKSHNFHAIGLSFIADKEGQYLKQSRFYINYAWHTQLTKKISLAAGTSLGFLSFLVSASSANLSGGATAPDATLGLWLYSRAFYAGISMNQIFNSRLTPLEETTKLVRHYNLTGGYVLHITESFDLTPRVLIRYAPEFPLDFDFAANAVIKGIVSTGLNYRHQKGVVPMVGFEKLAIANGNLKAMFSYAFPVGRSARDLKTYELMLNYQMLPAKRKARK
jgi:type IX secretion system PorP/SprF family membrane protein